MTSKRERVAERYQSALRAYAEGAGEAALQEAYEAGRTAMTGGLGVAELAEVHHAALARVIQERAAAAELAQLLRAAESVMVESLSSFEMTHREFREANAALRRWSERLENEAKRIAHALHDDAGQVLAAVYLALEEAAHDLGPGARERLLEVKGRLDEVVEQLRRLSHELRPTILDDLGLLPALDFLAEGVSSRTGLPITVAGSTDGRLPLLIETALYRIVQEALSNVSRHAQATRASVHILRERGFVRCSVEDDGIGFDAKAVMTGACERGIGMIGILERLEALGGLLQIDSAPRRGTHLHVTIPVESGRARSGSDGR